jgi:DNA-binding CsgD family transcriptional regulator
MNRKDLKPRERSLIEDLKGAWINSETLSELARVTDEFLCRLISADCMALCISRPGLASGYDWQPTNMPIEFFHRAPEWESDDFLRQGVILHPGTVMRDTDLISPEALKRNPMYRISREVGMPLSHAISVLLPFSGMSGHGGFTAYRSDSRSFAQRDQQLVQYVARWLALTLQKCRKFMEGDLHARLFGSVAREQRAAILVLAPPDGIFTQTEQVSKVMSDWWSAPSDYTPSGLPKELLKKLESLMGREETGTWERVRGKDILKVTFTRLPRGDGPAYWQLRFETGRHSTFVTQLKRLTPKEVQVLHALVQGKENKEIASMVHCAPGTVKKHVGSIFRKTGIHGRGAVTAKYLEQPPEKP